MNGSTDKYTTDTGKTRWRARWEAPLGPDGQRRRRSKGGFATRTDAQRHLRDVLAAQDRGIVGPSSDVTVAAYLSDWLARKRIRPTTRDNYRTCIHIHTIPRIGGLQLVDVNHRLLNELYRELESHGKFATPPKNSATLGSCRTAGITCPTHNCAPARHQGLSTKSVQHVHGTLRAAFEDAVRDGLLIRNPADLATPPRRTATQRRVTTGQVWTTEQARTFLHQVSDDPLEPLWTVALATGLRRAELVGLTWGDINLKNGTLEVSATTTVVRGRKVTSEGKTDAAQRRLSLDDHILDVLTKHQRSWVSRPTSAGHVFTDVDGNPLNPQRLTKHFARLADRMGLPKIGVHGLRHTAATLMLNHGVPIHIVANRLGHTDPSTTLSVYAHVMPDDDQIASTAIAQVLFNTIDQPESRLPGSAPATSVPSEGPPGQATDNAMGIRVATRSATAPQSSRPRGLDR